MLTQAQKSAQPSRPRPPLSLRPAFQLTDPETLSLIDFLAGVRRTLRRATREGHDSSTVVSAYEAQLSHWPAQRREAAMRAVLAGIDDADADWDTELAKVPAATDAILELLVANVEAMYPSNYITSLFKNASRCEALVRETAQQRA